MSDIKLSTGGVPIGTLTGFNIEDARQTARIHEIGVTGDLVPAGKQTFTATIKEFWLHPSLRPLPHIVNRSPR